MEYEMGMSVCHSNSTKTVWMIIKMQVILKLVLNILTVFMMISTPAYDGVLKLFVGIVPIVLYNTMKWCHTNDGFNTILCIKLNYKLQKIWARIRSKALGISGLSPAPHKKVDDDIKLRMI